MRSEPNGKDGIDEFCGKIKAMKDAQTDDDFVVVARVEAFIAGWGLKEALKRAEAYRKAGADAVLIHSSRSDATEIESFVKEWNGIIILRICCMFSWIINNASVLKGEGNG